MENLWKVPFSTPTSLPSKVDREYRLISFKYIFNFNLYPGKYWVKKKTCHTKVVGIKRTSPTIPHMTAFRTVLFYHTKTTHYKKV